MYKAALAQNDWSIKGHYCYFYQHYPHSLVRSAKKVLLPPFYALKSEPQGT